MWSDIDQITWSSYVVGAENHTPFLPQQVLYCNSCEGLCQGLKITFPLPKSLGAINKEKGILGKERESLFWYISLFTKQ